MTASNNVLTVTGASDDLIEIDGAIREEFSAYSTGEEENKYYLAIDGGALLSIRYGKGGIWRVHVEAKAEMTFEKVEGSEVDDTFDVVTVTSPNPIRWVMMGKELAKP